jgi:hypothetical protein
VLHTHPPVSNAHQPLSQSLSHMHMLMRRCGTTFDDAGKSCGALCPTGQDAECFAGEACFADVICASADGSGSANRCGTTYIAARTTCGALCPTGSDAECPSGQACFAAIVCTTPLAVPPTTQPTTSSTSASSSRCGTTQAAALSSCGTLCPSGSDTECPAGEKCFADVTCDSSTPSPSPPHRGKGPSLSKVDTIVSILAGIVGIGGGIAATVCWCKKHHGCGSVRSRC